MTWEEAYKAAAKQRNELLLALKKIRDVADTAVEFFGSEPAELKALMEEKK